MRDSNEDKWQQMVWMATNLKELELLNPVLTHYSSWASIISTTPISRIIYTYVFSPHQRTPRLDSILLTLLSLMSFLFCFLLHTYLVLVWFSVPFDYRHTWGVLRDFQKPLPLKQCFPTFHSRTSFFRSHSSYPPLLGHDSGSPEKNFDLLSIRPSVYVRIKPL